MTWNKEKTLKLIELFERFPILWNVHLPEYKDRYLKAIASERIAKDLEVSVEEVNRKLHNLRCQMNSEIRKIKKKKSGDGADDIWKSSWEYFDNLKFITGYGGSIKHEDLPVDEDEDLSSQGDHASEPQPSTSQSREKNRRSTSRHDENAEDVLLKKATVLLQKPYDEYTVFGDYVAFELRQIRSRLRRNRLKRIIQRAIVEMGEEEDAAQFRSLPPSTPELSWSPDHD